MTYTMPTFVISVLRILDRAVARLTAACAFLVIPLALLLCAQWPLRDWLHAYSREANDWAQLLFGVYVSVAIIRATRDGTHLTPDVLARRYSPALRARLAWWANLLVLLPWSLYVLVTAWPIAWQSLTQLEAFPETYNGGYFVLKLGVLLLALLVLVQALLDLVLPSTGEGAP